MRAEKSNGLGNRLRHLRETRGIFMRQMVEGQRWLLNPGDSLLFAARLSHRWCNTGKGNANPLIVLSEIEESNHPPSVHLKKKQATKKFLTPAILACKLQIIRKELLPMENVLVSWSGGKDSAIALHEILKNKGYRVSALLSTLTEGYDRISMHGVRRILLERQVASLGFPLEEVFISKNASNEEYELNMGRVLAKYKDAGVTSVVFGDIFLEDLRKYREEKLATLGLQGIFPLWKRDTRELAHSLTALGFKAVTTCVDTNTLVRQFVGRVIDKQFLSELPETVDLCGENGEYHSFVSDGPIFKEEISYALGEIVLRENRFYYCDLIPG
jgi:uncharacterized protein (TIGR00290 family)